MVGVVVEPKNVPVVGRVVVVIAAPKLSLITCPALIKTDASAVVLENASASIVIPVTESVDAMKVTVVRLVTSKNTHFPMEMTDAGMMMVVRAVP